MAETLVLPVRPLPTEPPRFGPFVTESLLGRGATATVWSARHAVTGMPAAVKVIHDPGWSGEEVRVAAGLSHPNVVRLFELGRSADEAPWVAMERASGGSLVDHPVSSWGAALRVLDDVLAALAHLHAHRLVHRDVKLGNLLRCTVVDGATTTRLADFGIATHSRGRAAAAGSVETLAPEQIRGEDKGLGPWTDLYALGVVATQLVFGRLPYAAATRDALIHAHLHATPDLDGDPSFGVPDGLVAVLRALLRKDPAGRFQRAADVRAALRGLGPAAPRRAAVALAARSGSETFAFTGALSEAGSDEGEAEERPPPPTPRDPWPDWRSPRVDAHSPVPDAGLGLLALRRAPLAGREAERAALWGLLARVARSGTPAVALVSGPAGVGKTAVLDWFAVRVDEEGVGLVAVLDTTPAAALAGVAGLSVAGASPARGLARWLRRFGPIPDGLVEDVVRGLASPEGPVGWWLRLSAHVGRTRPVVILVDGGPDVVDDVLRARPFVDGPWLVVAVDTGPSTPVRATADLRLALDPLPAEVAATVLEQQLPLAAGVAAQLLEEHGSLDAALRALRAAGLEARVTATAAGHVVAPRATPGTDAPAWFRPFAALGGSLRRDEVDDPDGWARAHAAGWVRGQRLELPLAVARRVWADDPDREARTTAAVAHWRAVRDGPRLGLALAVAGRGTEAVEAWLEDGFAAEAVQDQGRARRAFTRVEALVDAGEVADGPAVTALRAQVVRMAGNLNEARRLASTIADDPAVEDRIRARAWYTLAIVASRSREDASDVAAWTECDRLAWRAGAKALAMQARVRVAHHGGPDDAVHRALCAEVAAHAPEQLPYAEFRYVALLARVDPARARERIREALVRFADTAPASLLSSYRNVLGVVTDDLDEAAAAFEGAARGLEGSAYGLVPRANLAEVHLRRGRWAEARDEYRRVSWQVTHVVHLPWLLTPVHLGLAAVHAHDGDPEGALAHLRAAEEAFPASPAARAEHARLLGLLVDGGGSVADEARRLLGVLAARELA